MKTLLIYIFAVLPLFGLSEKVSLQLKWFHQFQFAGYYIAKEKGFYEDVGLNVEIRERDLSKDNVQQVINGEAEYGISDSVLFIYKANGKPIVLISPIFQHSPNVVITKKSSGLDSPYKLNDKRVIFYKKDVDGINILSMFKAIGITPNIMRIKNKKDPSLLLSGFADGYSGYITNEPFFFKKRGVGYNTIFPAHYGFDFYGDILFTSEEEAKNRPDRVKKFREATIKGWNYALDHLEESIEIIHKKYAKKKSIEHLRYEAKGISSLINRELFPLGQFDVGRVKFILNQYKDFDLIDNNQIADDYIFQEYRESEPILSEDDVEWLQKHKGIKIAVPLGLEPVIIKRQDGSFDGILVDYFKALSSLIGYKIELIPFNLTKENSLSASHKNSVYGDALILENSQYSDQFLKTIPYLETKLEVFTREELLSNIRSLDDLKNRRVAILKGNTTIKKYVESGEVDQIVETNSIKEQFNLLYSDEVDAVVGYSNYNYIGTD